MRKKILLAALMCVLIPLASYAIPITSLDRSNDNLTGYSPASSSIRASIILSKGFSITPPSSNPPAITLDKPSQPNSTKTTKTAVLKRKKPAPQLTAPISVEEFELPSEPTGGYPGENGQTTPAPVPEPATMLLLGAGLVGMATLKKIF